MLNSTSQIIYNIDDVAVVVSVFAGNLIKDFIRSLNPPFYAVLISTLNSARANQQLALRPGDL